MSPDCSRMVVDSRKYLDIRHEKSTEWWVAMTTEHLQFANLERLAVFRSHFPGASWRGWLLHRPLNDLAISMHRVPLH